MKKTLETLLMMGLGALFFAIIQVAMSSPIQQQSVIDKTTKQVKRHGFTDFQNDGAIDTNIEEVVIFKFDFAPDILQTNWYWNGTNMVLSL